MIAALLRWLARWFGQRVPVFEAFQAPNGNWHVREEGEAGQTVNVSDAYACKGNAVRSAKRLAAKVQGARWKVTPL